MTGFDAAEIAARRRASRREGRFLFSAGADGLWHFPAAATDAAHSVVREAALSAPQGPVSAIRLARAVRQDLWRALGRVRGFWPVVWVGPRTGEGLRVRAGGFVTSTASLTQVGDVAAALFEGPAAAGWVRYAAACKSSRGRECSGRY